MITTEMILSLGWEHVSTAKNGGSKVFTYCNNRLYSSADNFIYEQQNDGKQWEIRISKNMKYDLLYEGIPKDLKELKRILVECGADTRWRDEIRDEKINDILNND